MIDALLLSSDVLLSLSLFFSSRSDQRLDRSYYAMCFFFSLLFFAVGAYSALIFYRSNRVLVDRRRKDITWFSYIFPMHRHFYL